MQLSRETLDRFNEAVDAVASPASIGMRQAIISKAAEIADDDGFIPGDRVAELRDFAIEQMDDIGMAGAELASAAGAEFYDALRSEMLGNGNFMAEAILPDLHVANNKAVRGMIQKVVKTGRADVFAEECAQRVNAQIRRAPNETVAFNAYKDPAKPKWARVPGDAETCNFCLMLASRGFAYASEETASHGHAGCNCRVVPGFGEHPKVSGYDPDALYDIWVDKGRPMDLAIRGESVAYEDYFGDMDRRGKRKGLTKGTVAEQTAAELKAKDRLAKMERSGASPSELVKTYRTMIDRTTGPDELMAIASSIERMKGSIPEREMQVLKGKLFKRAKGHKVTEKKWAAYKEAQKPKEVKKNRYYKVTKEGTFRAFSTRLDNLKDKEELLTVAAAIERSVEKGHFAKADVGRIVAKLKHAGGRFGVPESYWNL